MSRDLKQLLHDTAAEPTRDVDPRGLVEQARRRTWMTRAMVSIVAILAVVGAALGAQQLLDRSQAPEIVNQPGQVQEPDGSIPSDWQTLHVGNATFAVPGEWSVQHIDGTDGPMPCLDRLETTEYRVYLADRLYTPSCPAGRSGSEAPTGEVTVYAFRASGGEGRGSVDVDVLLDEAAHIAREGTPVTLPNAKGRLVESDRLRSYLFADLDAVVLVAYRPDPQLADRILNTVRPAAEPTVDGELDCLNDKRFEQSPGLLPEGAEGAATAEQALREALEGYADRAPEASVTIVNDRQASVVINGREVVTTRATGTDNGWFTSEVTGCHDGWTEPQDTGSDAAEQPDCLDDTASQNDASIVLVYFRCGWGPDPLQGRPRPASDGGLDSRLRSAVTQFAQGPTKDEQERGYATVFPGDPSLLAGVQYHADTRTAVVSFQPSIRRSNGIGTSTATSMFLDGLQATVLQFDDVDALRLEIDGECWGIDPYGTCTFTRD